MSTAFTVCHDRHEILRIMMAASVPPLPKNDGEAKLYKIEHGPYNMIVVDWDDQLNAIRWLKAGGPTIEAALAVILETSGIKEVRRVTVDVDRTRTAN